MTNTASGKGTHQVGQKSANALGIYDMSGNVWEWCYDWSSDSVSTGTVTDPTGALSSSNRVKVAELTKFFYKNLRGGSGVYGADLAASCFRNDGYPNNRFGALASVLCVLLSNGTTPIGHMLVTSN